MNQALPAGTVLQGKVYSYTIQRVLGQGAFGITYLAFFKVPGPLGEVKAQAAVKEFFAKELDVRHEDGTVATRTEDGIVHKYAKTFQRESEILSKIKHSGIVNVLEAFDANGTYYYSMEYLAGGSLDDKVKGAGLPETEALALTEKIGEALSFMHSRKMMHLDLKPKNIMLMDDGTPVLIDFGLSKQYDEDGEPESSSTIGLGTPGYAPIEQATQTASGEFQPTLDVYALGATLYKMLTGSTPPAATLILNKKASLLPALQSKSVSDATTRALTQAMAPLMDDRPQSVEEFLSMLFSSHPVAPAVNVDEEKTEVFREKPEKPLPRPNPLPEQPPKPRKNQLKPILACLAAAMAILTVGQGMKTCSRPGEDTVTTSASSSGSINGHEWVDLGLSVKWATCNVGASSPSASGSYFAWGETTTKSDYSWKLYKFHETGDVFDDHMTFSKYNKDSRHGTVDNKTSLDLTDDVARAKWGGTWRMPTKAELDELRRKCNWTWTTMGGKNGYRVTSKTNGNSIFLPAAGRRYDTDLFDVGSTGDYGHYWSSSLYHDDPCAAYSLNFSSGDEDWFAESRCQGFSVRPVSK